VAYILFLLSLILFYLLHSLTAATAVRSYVVRRWIPEHRYRIVYNFVAFFTILPPVILYIITEKPVFFSQILLDITGWILMITGAGLGVISLRQYNLREFAGLDRGEAAPLVTGGLLSYVRHPLYLATILLISGFCCIDTNLWSLSAWLITMVYLVIGIRLEESKLIQAFGDVYRQYQERVPMIIPGLKKKKHQA
jgi:methanethiol S-methyltransferase